MLSRSMPQACRASARADAMSESSSPRSASPESWYSRLSKLRPANAAQAASSNRGIFSTTARVQNTTSPLFQWLCSLTVLGVVTNIAQCEQVFLMHRLRRSEVHPRGQAFQHFAVVAEHANVRSATSAIPCGIPLLDPAQKGSCQYPVLVNIVDQNRHNGAFPSFAPDEPCAVESLAVMRTSPEPSASVWARSGLRPRSCRWCRRQHRCARAPRT